MKNDYNIKLFDYILDTISDEMDKFEKKLKNIKLKTSHEPIHSFTQVDAFLSKTGDKILDNIHSVKFISIYDTEEWDFIDGIRSKIIVTNVDNDSVALQNYIKLKLINNNANSWTKLTGEIWVLEIIDLNANSWLIHILKKYYEEIMNESPNQYNIYIRSLSNHVINQVDDNFKINKFNWKGYCSNLGYLFKYLETSGYIEFPKNNVDMALENLMTSFNIKSSDKESLKEYLLNDRNKIDDKQTMFEKASNKHKENTDEYMLKLPNAKFLRQPKT